MRLQFADCTFDPDTREVTRAGASVPLSPKAFDLLGALIEKRPRVVLQAELRDRLWPHALSSHTSLARLVNEVRRAVGDRPRPPRFVRTVHSLGYAFCGDTRPVTAAPEPSAPSPCALQWGDREIPLPEGETLIGRAAGCALRIDFRQVSRRHARVRVAGPRAFLEDLASRNGTFLRGRRIQGVAELAAGDQIAIGPVLLGFWQGDDSATIDGD